MFNVVTTPKFSRTVTVKVPDGDGHSEQTFKAYFKVVKDDELQGLSWFETDHVKDVLRKVLMSADDLVGDDNKPVPFSDDVREGLLSLPYVRVALLKTYTLAQIQDAAGN